MKRAHLGVLLWAVGAAAAFGNAVSTNLSVSANLLATITVTTTSLDFGNWVIGGASRTATATISVKAQTGASYAITLDAGQHFIGGTFRRVANAGFGVPYAILDPSHTFLWGDAGFANTFPHGTPVTSKGTGSAQGFVLRGDLLTFAARPGSPAGLYTDNITVTVYW